MAIKPILFNTEMVRAILDGRKTCTRRLPRKQIEEKYIEYDEWVQAVAVPGCTYLREKEFYTQYPPYQPGDLMYVRETFIQAAAHTFWYKADDKSWMSEGLHWKPAIHMPKEAARIWLKVTGVRVERLQEITDEQAKREGIQYDECPTGFTWKQETDMHNCYTTPIGAMQALWNSTIKESDLDRYGWEANPWVWVIEFERCEKPEEKRR